MNRNHQEENPTNEKDRQRRLIGSSPIRILLTVTFIVNLLIVFRLIQPDQHRLLPDQFYSLIPTMKSSILFFLALAIASLAGLVWYGPEPDMARPQAQAVKISPTEEAPISKGKIVSFDLESESVQAIHLRQIAANV